MNENNNDTTNKIQQDNKLNFSNMLDFAKLSKLVLKDLTKNQQTSSFINKYSKDQITKYLQDPERNAKQLRDASIYLYNASNHYRRLINYFAKMALFPYILVPLKLNPKTVDKEKLFKMYLRNIHLLDNMNIKHEFLKIMIVAFREDVFYGYEYATNESYTIKKLPPDYCQISSIEDGCFNFAFDFAYFNKNPDLLLQYGDEFEQKYNTYKKQGSKMKWQELDSSRTICIKVNEDIEYPVVPFIGVLESLYDIEDFKALKKSKEEIGNYKILSLEIPMGDDKNDFKLDLELAKEFYRQVGNELPDNIGAILTPMKIGEHSFEKDKADSDSVAQAERDYWSASGVSQLLFNNEKASSSALEESIHSDEDIVFAVLRQFERWLNRKLKNESGTQKFKVIMLNITSYNQKRMIEQYSKAGSSGVPVKSALAATFGYTPSDIIGISYLENDLLEMRDTMFNEPFLMSSTLSPDSEGGRPTNEDNCEPLSDDGEKTKDSDGNKNRVK